VNVGVGVVSDITKFTIDISTVYKHFRFRVQRICAEKNFDWLEKNYKFGWESTEPQKIGGGSAIACVVGAQIINIQKYVKYTFAKWHSHHVLRSVVFRTIIQCTRMSHLFITTILKYSAY